MRSCIEIGGARPYKFLCVCVCGILHFLLPRAYQPSVHADTLHAKVLLRSVHVKKVGW